MYGVDDASPFEKKDPLFELLSDIDALLNKYEFEIQTDLILNEINNNLQHLISRYNDTHADNYMLTYTFEEGLDIIPSNYTAFKHINEISDNSLILYGYDWSFDTNKLIFKPNYMSEKEKIAFLIDFILQILPDQRKYFESQWGNYIPKKRKIYF